MLTGAYLFMADPFDLKPIIFGEESAGSADAAPTEDKHPLLLESQEKTLEKFGIDPAVFAISVVFAANCGIATPIGYKTGILVMGPGHYRFADYFRAGVPLIVILWIVFSLFAPVYYGL